MAPAPPSDAVRAADAEFLFDALNHTTSPVTINVTSLGASKSAVPKTMAGRIQQIARRYNLSLATTTMNADGVSGAAATVVPGAARRGRPPKSAMGKSVKGILGSTGEGSGSSIGPPIKRQKTNHIVTNGNEDIGEMENSKHEDEAEDEDASLFKKLKRELDDAGETIDNEDMVDIDNDEHVV